jgi:N-acetylglucosamine-6-sulfatase
VRGLLLLSVSLIGLAVGGAAESAGSKPSRPNIVVIETDDQRADDLRAMPNVGRLLAAQGTSFLNSFVANSLCCPSRATFLTGQYSHNNGVWNNAPPDGGWEALRPTQGNTLPAWLREAGYATIEIGKYLNRYGKNPPTEVPQGWTDWHGAVGNSVYKYKNFRLNENGRVVRYQGVYQTDLYAQKAVSLIGRYSAAGQPFFLWLTFTAPHTGDTRDPDDPAGFSTPSPAPRDRNRFARLPLPKPPSYNEADVSDKPRYIQRQPLIDAGTEAKIRESHQQRLESLLSVDRAVARIVASLEEAHELENTLIVFTSDNGYLEGEHRVTSGKRLAYEPSIRVPLIMRGPGVPAHRVVRTLVSNVDLAPTFVDVAGARAHRLLDGRSLVPLLRNPDLRWPRDLLIESPLSPPERTFTAVRTDRYLWIEYTEQGEQELYDLARDPYELTSLHTDPALASVRETLAQKLAKLRSCRGPTCRT